MRRAWSSGLAFSLCLGALAWSGVASAQDGGKDAGDAGGYDSGTITPGAILAYYCGEADLQCVITNPLLWEKKVEIPIPFQFDTGWIPQSFPELQVRFALKIPAETVVKLGGDFKTTWPQPLTVAVPGERYTGLLKFDYGLTFEALGKIDISVAGIDIDWQGPLPKIPQVDFHVLGGEAFDPWAFKPNVISASAYTQSIDLIDVNVLALANIPSEVAEGGVRLKVKGELKATYWTQEINVAPVKPPEQISQVPPIKSENGTSQHAFKGGGYVEYDVNPHGTVHYDGVIHLIPAFYVSVLNGAWDFDMPFYDFPVTISIGDQDFNFDKKRVHVPLPDIEPLPLKIYDFGQVDVGASKKKNIVVSNVGEAKARAVPDVEKSMATTFKVLTSNVTLEPAKTGDVQIRFAPKKLGPFQATLTLASNDPDLPIQTVTLKGQGVEPGTAPPDPEEDGGSSYWPDAGEGFYVQSNEDGGCGCRTSGRSSGIPMWAGLALMGAAVVLRRRRQAS
jgi:MYXO-CTERM domain-containing protein